MSIATNIAIKDLPEAINNAIAAIPSGGTKIWFGTINPNGEATRFSPINMNANVTGQYTVTQSTTFNQYEAYHLFDNNVSNFWIGTGNGTETITLDLGSGNTQILGRYSIQVNNVPEPARAPRTWTMLGSNDGTNFTLLDTVSNEQGWQNAETRDYDTDVATTAYRYFRWAITANNGDGQYTQSTALILNSLGTPFEDGNVGDLYFNTITKRFYGPFDGETWDVLGDLA